MRSYASASIAFGLVVVPVKLYAAIESSADVSFNLLHKTCGSRLRQQYECPQDNVVVPREDMIRGFEFEKGKYVQFTDEEIEQLEVAEDKAIEIDYFVKLGEIDTLYFDSVHFLGPDKGADRGYLVLARAMAKAKRVAVGRYAARGKQHLVLLMSIDDRLVMRRLHYGDEVRALDQVPAEDAPTPASLLKLAVELIHDLEQPKFDASAYRDEVKARKRERIQDKIEGREISVQPSEKQGAQIIDLGEALKASTSQRPRRKASGGRSSSASSA